MGLTTFTLSDLGEFTREGTIPEGVDHWLFYVGRDDVHGLLKHLLSNVTISVYMNMFGYDDEELNDILWGLVQNPEILTAITLDKSQAGGVHEKKILDADMAANAETFNAHFTIGRSATHQIAHTKGGVLDGIVGFEGSTNWSISGEGAFVTAGAAGGTGYKAQNNTVMVFTDQITPARFTAELLTEHLSAAPVVSSSP